MKILGIGDNVVDRFLDRQIMYPGGQAMNVPVYAGKLGAQAAYMGAFGDDEMGNMNARFAESCHLDISRCVVIHGENAFARVMTVSGERVFLGSNKGGVAKERPWNFSDEEGRYISGFDVIHTDQNSYIEEDLPYLSSLGPAISFDFSFKHDEEYIRRCAPYCTVCFISMEKDDSESAVEQVLRLAADCGVKLPVVTLGEGGSAALYQGSVIRWGIKKTEVKDTMGAGDAFAAGFITMLFSHKVVSENLVKESLKRGAETAATVCGMEGAHGHGVPFTLTVYEQELLNSRKKENEYGI